jgi:hypothetical protein
MKTTIEMHNDKMIFTSRKDMNRILTAIAETGVDIRMSEVSRKTGLPVSTVFDVWKRFEKRNKISAVIHIEGK